MRHVRLAAATALALVAAAPAHAHTFGAAGAGLAEGLSHPFGGLDHLLAMVAVGLYAAQRRGPALWALPLAFVAMMGLGAGAGLAGLGVPLVESGIVVSLLVVGGLVASGRGLPLPAALAMIGGFAVFHGHAHASEAPMAASALHYGLGFLAATALLHAAGIAAALLFKGPAVRLAGAAVAATGVLLLAA